MKVLNLYAGIGGNRKLWKDVEVTAVEYNSEIASIYQDFFPNDKVIVGDAHQYLLDHFNEFDYIWSSPPCPSHSVIRKMMANKTLKNGDSFQQNKPIYPDMKLYEEILLLQGYFKGKYAVENVKPFYEPLIKPQIVGRHCIWSNYIIPPFKAEDNKHFSDIQSMEERKGFDLSKYHIKHRKDQILRNCVDSKLSLHVLESSITKQVTLSTLGFS